MVKKAPPEKRTKTSASEPRRVAAKPRKRGGEDNYDYGDMGNTGGTRGSRGNKILSPEAQRVQLWRPTWDKNIPTTVRILPTVDPEDTSKIIGYRKSAGHSKFTPWCFGAPATQFVGIDEKFSFLLYNPTWIRTRNYDPGTNPYQILFDEFHSALKNEEARLGKRDVLTKKWYGLGVKSENQKRRAFTRVNPMHFYRVFMYAHKDKYLIDPKTGLPFGAGKKDPAIILQVAKSGGEALQSRLNRKNEGVSEDAPYKELFEFGDITLLKGGKFVTFLGPDHINSLDFSKYGVKVTDEDESGPDLGDDDADDADDDGGDDSFNKRWRVHIHREFTYVTKKKKRRKIDADISALRNTVLEKYEWWEDILNFPSHEEICIWLAQGFRSMPDVVRYGWRDNKEFLTDEVKGILAARTQGPGAEVPSDEDEEEDEGEEGEEGEEEEGEDEEEEAPRRKKKKNKNVRASSVAEDDEEEGDDEGEEGEDEEESDDEGEDESEDEDEGEDESEDEDEGEDEEGEGEDEEGDESEDEEEDEPPPRPKKNKKVKVKVKAKKRREAEAEDESEDEGDDEEGDESSSNGDEASALKRAKKAALERAARRGNKPSHKVKIKKKIKS